MDAVIGQLVNVNLTTEAIAIQKISDQTFKRFMGGNGLAAKVMLANVSPGIDPLSPDNVLVFASRPLARTGIQGSDRILISSKSL